MQCTDVLLNLSGFQVQHLTEEEDVHDISKLGEWNIVLLTAMLITYGMKDNSAIVLPSTPYIVQNYLYKFNFYSKLFL